MGNTLGLFTAYWHLINHSFDFTNLLIVPDLSNIRSWDIQTSAPTSSHISPLGLWSSSQVLCCHQSDPQSCVRSCFWEKIISNHSSQQVENQKQLMNNSLTFFKRSKKSNRSEMCFLTRSGNIRGLVWICEEDLEVPRPVLASLPWFYMHYTSQLHLVVPCFQYRFHRKLRRDAGRTRKTYTERLEIKALLCATIMLH